MSEYNSSPASQICSNDTANVSQKIWWDSSDDHPLIPLIIKINYPPPVGGRELAV